MLQIQLKGLHRSISPGVLMSYFFSFSFFFFGRACKYFSPGRSRPGNPGDASCVNTVAPCCQRTSLPSPLMTHGRVKTPQRLSFPSLPHRRSHCAKASRLCRLSVCFPANKQIKRRRFGRDECTHQHFSRKHAEISAPG